MAGFNFLGMKHFRRLHIPRLAFALAAAAGLLTFLAPVAQATATYPTRPLRIIVPFPPGGSTDVLGRLLATEMGKELGQPVVVDNKPGAGGDIASVMVARAAPDGYTLLLVSSGFVVNPTMYDTKYDPIKDFAPVCYIAGVPSLLVTSPSVKATNLQELVQEIERSPAGKYNFASTGIGSVQHLAGELFKREAQLDIAHVPYNGAGPAIAALLGDHVQMLVASVPALQAQVQAGNLRAMATTMADRLEALPDVPTFKESGYGGVLATQIQGILVPAGTPPEIVNRLNQVLVSILRRPDIDAELQELGFLPVASTPEAFAQEIRSQVQTWGRIVKQANIKPE